MLRVSTGFIFQRGLEGMLNKQAQMSETQQQIASGKRIITPSDDPSAAARALDFSREIKTLEQYRENITLLKNRLEREESTLDGMTDIIFRLQELTVQGSTDSYSSVQREYIATEMRELLGGLVDLANSTDTNGEYLFSGYQGRVKPFESNGASFSYEGDMGKRMIRISANRTIADGDTGFELFMDIPTSAGGVRSAFDTITQIAATLEAGQSPNALIDDLDLILDNFNEVRATVGARMNAIDEQERMNDTTKLALETHRSELQDLDYAEAITRFNQEQVALSAAQQVFVKMQDMFLFNFLR
jgi:flagellar hook-associated protein 3 FlgL